MKEDFSKPLYADCKWQKAYKYFWSEPVLSRERSYKFADRPLAITGWLLIIFAIGFIGVLTPLWRDYYSPFNEVALVFLVLIILAEFFYTRKFVCRFGRFRVKWEDAARHPNEAASSRCDEDGKFLKTEENRTALRKSRRAFLALFAGIIAAVLLYCFLGPGLSYTRVYSWRMGEIEEAKQIAQKYDYVIIHTAGTGASVGGEKEGGGDISQQDRRRLWEIFRSLHWDYVSDLYISCKDGYIVIGIDTPFGHSKLVWFEDVDKSEVGYSFAKVTQIGEHWFYVRMNDGSGF